MINAMQHARGTNSLCGAWWMQALLAAYCRMAHPERDEVGHEGAGVPLHQRHAPCTAADD
jgi:hypothetical protein